MTSVEFFGGDCSVRQEPDGRWRARTGWGVEWRHTTRSEALAWLADRLRERDQRFSGLAAMVEAARLTRV